MSALGNFIARNKAPVSVIYNCSANYSKWKLPNSERRKGTLVLQDGSVFPGYSFGYEPTTAIAGETVFNTGMVGYNESLTDPSYRGQFLAFTYPLIGNYGVPPKSYDNLGLLKYFESDRIQPSAVLVAQYEDKMSHFTADRTLSQWLIDEQIPGLTGLDTRHLTKKLRERGSMLGKIIFDGQNDIDLHTHDPNVRNLVAEVSTNTVQTYGDGDVEVIAIDCGMKNNIIRRLCEKGCKVTVVPWNYDFRNKLEGKYDGVFISNGPGDPALAQDAIKNIRAALNDDIPIFGICMGNQLLAHAAGARTYKLPFGNRGQNQPAMDTTTKRVYITPQNHGYAVDSNTLPKDWEQYFININDLSNEGIYSTKKPHFSVQFHPEASSGPQDTDFLFDKFINLAKSYKKLREKHSVTATGIKPVGAVGGTAKVKKVLILGSGGLQIGQAGEFDYSGAQSIKALKEEGVETVLINPNIATIQTGKGIADKVYFFPVTPEFVEEVIKKERPDGILLGFGGQTGLNCGLAVADAGILEKYGVRVLGTSVETIRTTEDRLLFNKALDEINQPYAPSVATHTIEESLAAANKIGYPVICRVAYALGGLGSGFAHNDAELREITTKGFAVSPQCLIEKSIKGWKEVEYEVVRDQSDNCLTVCNMENFDPMGIHTGESIVIAPSQTLSNDDYHMLRTAAINVVRHLGIVGECNIQYALNPYTSEYCIIEVNPRLSRSSALASKATGYPLAAVAAKISLGIDLPHIKNAVTRKTSACFEPSLDYVVVKMPKWDLKKFTNISPLLGSSMKSVGEVMAIGRTFEESIQKAIRMVDTSNVGFQARKLRSELDYELTAPSDQRIFALAEALDKGYTVDKLFDMTKIDRWWLNKLVYIKQVEKSIIDAGKLENIGREHLLAIKRAGYSDFQISKFLKVSEEAVRTRRKSLDVVPIVKQIDTLAGEFPAETNYLYTTYNGTASDVQEGLGGIVTLGSGVYRIGSSVEFDYCSVSCIRALRKQGKRTITVNYNPETVSTDYDESDQLYFEELSEERVRDIYEFEGADGIVVSVGGQQPNNIALKLANAGLNVLGTSATSIDAAEDRDKFSSLLDSLKIDQPKWSTLTNFDAALKFAREVEYPVLVRPSYVLSGAAMNVANSEQELVEHLEAAGEISGDYPVVISKFIVGAKEIECDAVAQNGKLINWAVSLHIENAGVHSGDATHVLPSGLPSNVEAKVLEIAGKIGKALNISGPYNTQFLYKDDKLLVIETNLRASRSFPFVSKTLGIDFIDTATKIFLGIPQEPNPICSTPIANRVCVKCPQFSYQRLHGADPKLGVEMGSTGEVACFGRNAHEAFLKSMLSTNAFKLPKENILLSGDLPASFSASAKSLSAQGYKLFATPEIQPALDAAKVQYTAVNLPNDKDIGVLALLRNKTIHMTINIPKYKEDVAQYKIRRTASDFGIPLINNVQIAEFTTEALEKYRNGGLEPLSWDEYFPAGHVFHTKQ